MIQKHVKGWLQRRSYIRFRGSLIAVQSLIRGWLVRHQVETLRKHRAAIIIQSWYKGSKTHSWFRKLKMGVECMQNHIRGHLGRMSYKSALTTAKAILIQRHVRGWLARRRYQNDARKIVVAQSAVRRWLAVRELKRLKVQPIYTYHYNYIRRYYY